MTKTGCITPYSIFLFVGLVTVVTAPIIWWRFDSNVTSARFLSPNERAQAVERLRANNTGIGSQEFKWDHVLETFMDPKTYLWIGLALLLNVGAAVTNVFGPIILEGLGFNKYITSLLNMPFGALQFVVILLGSYASTKSRLKSPVIIALMLPVITGLAMLYVLPRDHSKQGPLLVAYYFLACLYGVNPLLVSWIVANTAGTTKKSITMSLFNIGVSAGNIIGPLLFSTTQAPSYHPGLRAVLGINIAMVAVIIIQVANLMLLNKLQQRKRIASGKTAIIHDRSMDKKFSSTKGEGEPAENSAASATVEDEIAYLDLTDRKNDEFVYLY